MLRNYLLGTLLASSLLACQPMTTELTADEQSNNDTEHKHLPVPSNKYNNPSGSNPIAGNAAKEHGLRLIKVINDELGFRHMKYQAIHQGVPVWNAETIIHINKEGKIYRVDGAIPVIDQALNTNPSLNAESAATAALAELTGDGWTTSNTELFIYTTEKHTTLVWQVECVNAVKRKLLIVDATTGKVLKIVERSYS